MDHALFLPGALHGTLGFRPETFKECLSLGRGFKRLFASVAWNDITPSSEDVYDWRFLDEAMMAAEKYAPGSKLILLIADRDFQGSTVLPDWVHEVGAAVPIGAGHIALRWTRAVVDAQRELHARIHERYRWHESFGGTMTGETAFGNASTLPFFTIEKYAQYWRTRLDFEPLGAEVYLTANLFPQLREDYLADLCRELSARGIWCGAPDVRPDDKSLRERHYGAVDVATQAGRRFGVVSVPSYLDAGLDVDKIRDFAVSRDFDMLIWRFMMDGSVPVHPKSWMTPVPPKRTSSALAFIQATIVKLQEERDLLDQELARVRQIETDLLGDS